jgi:hypothetical protein
MAVSTKNCTRVEIFKGTRNYWRFRTNIDVNLIDHTEAKILEIVCFCADVMLESRQYLSGVAVLSRIDMGKLENLVATKKEEYSRRKKAYVDKDVRDEVRNGLIADYLLNRITINLDKEKPLFEFSLVAPGSEETDTDLIVAKPEDLVPYAIDRARANAR